MHPSREVRPLCLAGRIVANCGKDFAMDSASRERVQHLMHASDGR
jgi:hypothetical protein